MFKGLEKIWLAGCLGLLVSTGVMAQNDRDLFTLETLVTDTSEATRAQAANELLRTLLVRISGSREILDLFPPEQGVIDEDLVEEVSADQQALWDRLSSAQRWVSQYRYHSTREILITEAGREVMAQQLTLTFDPAGIHALLNELGQPIWDAKRPRILLWLALEGRQGRYLITQQSNPELANHLNQLAQERGLPLVLPDLQRHPVSNTLLSDVWGGFLSQVQEASQPYEADIVALARIRPVAGQWEVHWELNGSLDQALQRLTATSLGEALDLGIDYTARTLAARYATTPSQEVRRYRLAIAGIELLNDYAQLQAYFDRLVMAEQIQLLQADDDQLLIEVKAASGLSQLRANMALEPRWQEVSSAQWQQRLAQQQSLSTATSSSASSLSEADAYFVWRAER